MMQAIAPVRLQTNTSILNSKNAINQLKRRKSCQAENSGMIAYNFNDLRHMNGNLHPLMFWEPVMRVTFPLIPAASTTTVSVQVSGFEDMRLLTHCSRLLCDFCSSGQCFACGFLQIPPRDGHPCRSANRSPCRVDSGLSPPSHPAATTRIGTAPVKALRAMPGAPN